MQIGQLLAGDQPQPEVERHRLRVAGVVGSRLRGFEVSVLQDVIGVDPAGEAAVEPQPDQPAEPLTLAVEQRSEGPLVAGQARDRSSSALLDPELDTMTLDGSFIRDRSFCTPHRSYHDPAARPATVRVPDVSEPFVA